MTLFLVMYAFFDLILARPRSLIRGKIESFSDPLDVRALWTDVPPVSKSQIFIECCRTGHIDAARKILAVDPEIVKGESYRCLRSAAHEGMGAIVKLLVHEHGLDPNVLSSGGGDCALVIAVQNGHQNVVDTLLLSKVDEYIGTACKRAFAHNKVCLGVSIFADPRCTISKKSISSPDHSFIHLVRKCKAGLLLESEEGLKDLSADDRFVLMKCAGAYGHISTLSWLLKSKDIPEAQFDYLIDYSMYFQRKDSVCIIARHFVAEITEILENGMYFDHLFSTTQGSLSSPRLKRAIASNMQLRATMDNQLIGTIPGEIMSTIFWFQIDDLGSY